MNFLLAHFFQLVILLAVFAVAAIIIYFMFNAVFNQSLKTDDKLAAAKVAGHQLAEEDISQQIAFAQLQPTGARAGVSMRNPRAVHFMLLMLVVCVAGRIEFGEVRGRFRCEDTLACGRDNTYHELRFRVYPLEASEEWVTVPWLFAPFNAEDAISGPATCDPRKTGQCYLMNGGNLTVSVRAAPLFWHNALTKHPVYEFPSSYAVNSTRAPGNVTSTRVECERLRYHTNLFGDAGACWKHLCVDGGDVVDTETVGVGPGCGLFELTDAHAQLATAFEVRVQDVERNTGVTLAFDNVRPGARVQNRHNTMHAHIDTYAIPGGENWVYPQHLHGGIVACNWRATWDKYRPLTAAKIGELAMPPPGTSEAGWYYVSPGRILKSYGHRACGMNGPALYELAPALSGGDCADGPSFEDGDCLPTPYPAHILDGTAWDDEYMPPTWTSTDGRAGLWQKANGRRAIVHLAKARDFLPGEPLFYEVVLRVATPVARTDKNNQAVFHSALCVEQSALACVQDPVSRVVRIDTLIGNRSPNANATGVTGSIACAYNDQSAVNRTVGNVTTSLGTIVTGDSARLATIFMMPEEGTRYGPGGVATTREKPSFTCAVELQTPVGAVNSTYKWEGAVTCAQLANLTYIPQRLEQDCGKKEHGELVCRINQGQVGESTSSIAYLTVVCISMAFNIGLAAYLVYKYRRMNADNDAKLAHAQKNLPSQE